MPRRKSGLRFQLTRTPGMQQFAFTMNSNMPQVHGTRRAPIDNELDRGRKLDRQITRPSAPEDPIDEVGQAAPGDVPLRGQRYHDAMPRRARGQRRSTPNGGMAAGGA